MNQIVDVAVIAVGGLALLPVLATLIAQARPRKVPVRVRARRER